MKKYFYAVCLVLVFQWGVICGQSQSNTADLMGTIKDQTGAVLPGATVTSKNTDTGATRSVVTGDTGSYRMPLLPPGTYEVRTELAGFVTKVLQGIVLTVGQYATLDVTLELASTETLVTVMESVSIVEREKTVQASTIQEIQIDNLPINGRNFLDFALLTPGVSDKHTLVSFGVPQAPTSGLSFAGQDQRSNYVMIDGADNIDVASNSVRSTLSQEAIQEFQISRNTFSAEFGRARGGIINIVSKSGTNNFHGDAFFFFRNNSLDARNTFAFGPLRSPIDPPFERYQWGGTLGGPIVQDRTFFFGSYERLGRDESIFVTFLEDESIFRATGSQKQLFGFLDSTGVPSLKLMAASFIHPSFGVLNTLDANFKSTLDLFRKESGVFPFTADSDTVSMKVDHQFTSHNQLFARFNVTDAFNNGVQFGALQGISQGVSFDTRDYAFVVSDTHIFSPVTLNDLKFQYARRRFDVPTNDPLGPELVIGGAAVFGRDINNPTGYLSKTFQWIDNLTFIRGRHTVKAGADVNIWDLEGFAQVFMGGQFRFGEAVPLAAIMNSLLGPNTAAGLIRQLSIPSSAGGLGRPDLAANVLAPISAVQSFNFGLPISYLQSFGNPNTTIDYRQLALYLQDSWKLRQNFTLNLGVRYDVDWRPETVNVTTNKPPFGLESAATSDRNNISPRLGFAFDPRNNGKTVVRGGYGIYYQNFFQALGFVGKVLSGQVSQVFLPLTGLPGINATSKEVFAFYRQTGKVGEQALAALGISPGRTPSVILPTDANPVNPYSHHASFGIEQELARDWAVSLDYMLNRGVHLIRGRNINVREVAPNKFALPGLDPRFLQLNLVETSGSSIYHGFTASARKRFGQNYGILLAYTLGKSIDDTTDFTTNVHPDNHNNLRAERGLSTFDQRQRFVVSGVWKSPYQLSGSGGVKQNLLADWTIAPIVTWASGRPFNLLLGFDINGDTHGNTDRPRFETGEIVGRNTGIGPSFFTTDLRVARKFTIREGANFEFIFEAFNLFNNVNYSGVNNVVGNLKLTTSRVKGSKNIPANQPLGFTSAHDPRQIQFGFRLNF